MYEILQTEPAIGDKPDAQDLSIVEGVLEFRNVSFGYDQAKSILKNISFSTSPGKKTALVRHNYGPIAQFTLNFVVQTQMRFVRIPGISKYAIYYKFF